MDDLRRVLAKSEMVSNHPEHGGHHDESPPASERIAAKESSAKGETIKTIITAPPSIEEFCE
jgi:hypothetical protein